MQLAARSARVAPAAWSTTRLVTTPSRTTPPTTAACSPTRCAGCSADTRRANFDPSPVVGRVEVCPSGRGLVLPGGGVQGDLGHLGPDGGGDVEGEQAI